MQARLQSLEEQQQDGAAYPSSAGVGVIAWRGQTCVVSAERVRVALGQALDLSKQVSLPLLCCPSGQADAARNPPCGTVSRRLWWYGKGKSE